MFWTVLAVVAVGTLALAVSGIVYLFGRAISGLPLTDRPEGG